MAEVIILAAGLGLRMRPLTEHRPKPLIPVAGKCLIDHALDFAASGGVESAVVNISYRAEMMEAHLKSRAHPRILLSREEAPLETGGGIAQALTLLSKPFFSINGDVICLPGARHPFERMREAWDEARMDALLLLHPVESAIGYEGKGDFFLDGDALARRGNAPAAPYVFSGAQMLHPRLFEGAPKGAFSMNLLYDRDLSRVRAIVHDGGWLHVGDAAGLQAAEAALKEG